ncbi:MAG TPA: tyrosine--tRNA ligase, partial [Gemmataceae bacterium]|nr:tyrosine--tRNA ligase [Gemmataceae bacterium]
MKSVAEQLALIRRGADQIEPFEELQRKLERSLQTRKPLRVKYGIDPTAADVHLGHTVPLRKMRLFQELGHQAVLIIGNYTALVGDPSGRDQTRAKLTQEMVEANASEYLQQVSKIIDISKTEVHRNGDWFSKYSFLQTMEMFTRITVQQMLDRDDFKKRLGEGKPIILHECWYPLMQGQDSVEIHADIELGGREQLFNLMVGRDFQQRAGQEPQVCITLPILRGLDGDRRMGKSPGNYIGVGEPAREQFGKTMSIPDELLKEWFELLTDRSEAEIAKLIDPNQSHPMEAKKTLAADIVTFYHGADAAKSARADWEKQFSEKLDPDEIPTAAIESSKLTESKMGICPLLVAAGLAPSNKEARRKIGEGAVNIGPERRKITDPNEAVAVQSGL